VGGERTVIGYAVELMRRLGILQSEIPDLVLAGTLAVVEANRMWQRNVVDLLRGSINQASREVIDAIIRTDEGLGWSWEQPYRGDNDFQWCGAFAAWCWAKAGMRLDVRKNYLASTYRLDRFARYQPINERVKNERPKLGPYRTLIELDEFSKGRDVPFRAGDIMTIGSVSSVYGQHICIVESYDANADLVCTIEGNGGGELPGGSRGQGIVRGKRQVGLRPGQPPTVYHARRLIRPAPSDLT
jgi:hypothetical protein